MITNNLKIIKLKKELLRFLFAGIVAVSIDLIIYFILLDYFSHNFSKLFSFIAGTFAAYLINKFWTFEKRRKSYLEIIKFALLYTLTMFCNVYINKITLDYTQFIILGFLVATGFSSILNFLGQKFWVFKR